jgi:hypothetical protein
VTPGGTAIGAAVFVIPECVRAPAGFPSASGLRRRLRGLQTRADEVADDRIGAVALAHDGQLARLGVLDQPVADADRRWTRTRLGDRPHASARPDVLEESPTARHNPIVVAAMLLGGAVGLVLTAFETPVAFVIGAVLAVAVAGAGRACCRPP